MSERPGYTLADLRAFWDSRRHDLACREKRRGWWGDERTEHEVCEATIGLIDRINADSVVMNRLKRAAGK